MLVATLSLINAILVFVLIINLKKIKAYSSMVEKNNQLKLRYDKLNSRFSKQRNRLDAATRHITTTDNKIEQLLKELK